VLPPLRAAAHGEALRSALRAGALDVVASDHAPHAPAEKAAGDVWSAPAGLPGLETLLGVLMTVFGRAAPEIVARACAAAPAARFGLAGRKGRIAVGLDADLVLVDQAATWTVGRERLHTRAQDSPFAGRELAGAVRHVLRRGELLVADGAAVAGHGPGKWLRPAAAAGEERAA
jgi:dihydroorotase